MGKKILILLLSVICFLSSVNAAESNTTGFNLSFNKTKNYYVYFTAPGSDSEITQGNTQYFTSNGVLDLDNSETYPTLELNVKYCLPEKCTLRLMLSAQPEGTSTQGQGYMLINDSPGNEGSTINGINFKVQAADDINKEYPESGDLVIDPPPAKRSGSWPIENRVMVLYNTWGRSSSEQEHDVDKTGKLRFTIMPFAETGDQYTFNTGLYYGYAYLILQMK